MRILVTGGAGFIGSNFVEGCLKQGFSVDVVDNLSNGHLSFVPKNLLLEEDSVYLCDFASPVILNKIRQKNYDVVVHLAAQPRVSYSMEQPIETHQTNVEATLRLIDACRGNVTRFVFASTSAVYGNVDRLPTNESADKKYQSPYAIQKLIVEDYLRLFGKLYDFDSVCLRFFNVFGPHQLGSSPYSTAVSAWLNAIMKGDSMRSDGDGSQSRDMCYVGNVVDACLLATTSKNSFKGEAFNVACGEKTTNKEILSYLMKKFPDSKYHDAPWRAGDVMHTQADLSNITSLLGYKPSVMFWQGLDLTIQWYQDNWDTIKEL
jgi:nucleoside-diphosphate-sugar epimerase